MTPPTKNRFTARRWLWFGLAFITSVVILLAVPRSASVLLFLILIAGAAFLLLRLIKPHLGAIYRWLNIFARRQSFSEQSITIDPPPAQRWLLALEIAFVIIIACLATHEFLIDDPSQTLGGGEVDGDVHSTYFAAITLREKGYIPLWNPWLEFGHPVINNAKSIILNPFSTGPALLFGGVRGIKLGVVLSAILAGVGGWFLGRVLGFQTLGRVLLGLLLIGKGNMLAMIGAGYYPLGTSQAYFPWIIAGAVGIVWMPRARWPVGLTALALVLMFWAGTIWYTLPLLFNVALLVLAHLIRWGSWQHIIRRMIVMGGFAIGLGAVSLFPIWAEQQYMGDHPNELDAGRVVNVVNVIEQFVNGSSTQTPGAAHFYYSYVVPLWFLALLFVIIPLLWPPGVSQPVIPHLRRIWLVGLVMIVLCIIWGAGGNSFFMWMYRNLPLLAQWRFVARALAVASFWIAVQVAMRVDAIWRAILSIGWKTAPFQFTGRWQYRVAGLLAALCALVAYDVIRSWDTLLATTVSVDYWLDDEKCLSALRAQHPQPEPLAVYRYGYKALVPYFQQHVRETTLDFDFEPQPLPSTLTRANLRQPQVGYGVAVADFEREVLLGWDYTPVEASPLVNGAPCLFRRPDPLSYAYTVPLETLRTPFRLLPPSKTIPVTEFVRDYDRIHLQVQPQGNGPQVITVQELAYPGWEVFVDDKPATLEVAGGQIAVVLPPDNTLRAVDFYYRPQLVFTGGKVTLASSALFTLYLLRVDWLLLNLWRKLRRRFAE